MTHPEPEQTLDESSEILELSDGELENISGGGCGNHGPMRRRKGGRGRRASQSNFSKHSLSISGQTITKPDGTSITSFSIKEESITSSSSEMIEF
ncbi:MAG: hypothetical protein HC860_13190 [Alkalinema sp. RU_4_3]|nr:hypothetical protein [Alkalinema sp. RU_4_3]